MDEEPLVLGGDEGHRAFTEFAACYDVPAYVRRGLQVEAALEQLLERCRQQQDEWLRMVRLNLGRLVALAGDWQRLRPLVSDDAQVGVLERLHQELKPKLRVPVERTRSTWALRLALRELIASLEEFNRRWREYLPTVDIGWVNQLRDDYNRYYVVEKECALRSATLARRGFQPLAPLTPEEVARRLPPLPVPMARTSRQ